MGVEILIPLAGIGMIIAIVVIPAWLKSRERREMQATLRSAIDKGQTLPPEVVDLLSRENIKAPATATRDLRTGVILLSVSIGIAIMGYMINFEAGDAFYPMIGISAIPGMIGLAFVILSFFNKNKG
jgi:hypothetical protein